MDTFLIYFFGVLTGVGLALLIFYITMSDEETEKDIKNIEQIQKLSDYIEFITRKEANYEKNERRNG